MTDTIRNETDLIQTYLAPLTAGAPGALGLADDAGYFTPPPGTDVVVTTDPIVAGVHFFGDGRPDDIGYKALAVNVSDLAAKGATPLCYTMALALPHAPERTWMGAFASGLAAAQRDFGCTLLGGDTDRHAGPLTISITAFGVVPSGGIVARRTARIGDRIFVTGTIGDAALGLELQRDGGRYRVTLAEDEAAFLAGRYLRPAPRLALAPLLRAHASAALDISDGLIKDLGRLAAGAGGRAIVVFDDLPLSRAAASLIGANAGLKSRILSGGDDYEILFTVPAARVADFEAQARALPFHVTGIGTLGDGKGVVIAAGDGKPMIVDGNGGWDHFS